MYYNMVFEFQVIFQSTMTVMVSRETLLYFNVIIHISCVCITQYSIINKTYCVLLCFLDLFFVKTIQELMQMVKKLREDVEAQVSGIK